MSSGSGPGAEVDNGLVNSLLPVECLLQVLENLDYTDAIRCTEVCKHWYNVARDSQLWKRLTYERWSLWPTPPDTSLSWFEVFRDRHASDRRLHGWLWEMSESREQREQRLQDIRNSADTLREHLLRLNNAYSESYEHISDYYYAHRALRDVELDDINAEWGQLIENVQTDAAPVYHEDAAILVSRTGRPEAAAGADVLRATLDEMGEALRDRIDESFGMRSNDDIASIGAPVLDVVRFYLFEECGFRGADGSDYYNPENSFLASVLERKVGIPISLCVVYGAVCRRVGIHVDMINAPSHFLARFVDTSASALASARAHGGGGGGSGEGNIGGGEGTSASGTDGEAAGDDGEEEEEIAPPHYFIDVHGGGTVMNAEEVKEFLGGARRFPWDPAQHLQAVGVRPLAERMLRNLQVVYHNAHQKEQELVVCRMSQLWNPNDYQLMNHVNNLHNSLNEALPESRSRGGDLVPQYHVGQVVSHGSHGYAGVIRGWTLACEESFWWKLQMGVTAETANRPWYWVMIHTGDRPASTAYVAEKNITLPEFPVPIEHPDLGKFFSSWEPASGDFMATPELRSVYPDL